MKVTNQTSQNSPFIENKTSDRVAGSTEAAKKSPSITGKQPSSEAGSLVEISDNARLMQRAVEVAKQAPDGRAEKIASIKKAVQDGTYKVDAQQIADRLVEDHLSTGFGKNDL